MCDLNHCFKNAKVTKLLWVKFIVGANERVHKVKCKVCRKIKGHNKLLVLKLNFFVEAWLPKKDNYYNS
jgi:hypothetical protein